MTTTTPGDTMTIGRRLVELCAAGRHLDAVNELYADDIVSIEASAGPDGERTTTGLDAVRGKNEWWLANHEMHASEHHGPFPHEDRFAVGMSYDVTAKAGPMAGQRFEFREIGVYTVENGRIVKEEYFYDKGA